MKHIAKLALALVFAMCLLLVPDAQKPSKQKEGLPMVHATQKDNLVVIGPQQPSNIVSFTQKDPLVLLPQKPAKEAEGQHGALTISSDQAKEYEAQWGNPVLSFNQKWTQITIGPGSGVEKVQWTNAAGQTVTLTWDAHGILTVTTSEKSIGFAVHVHEEQK